jgi:hypothetical protein
MGWQWGGKTFDLLSNLPTLFFDNQNHTTKKAIARVRGSSCCFKAFQTAVTLKRFISMPLRAI